MSVSVTMHVSSLPEGYSADGRTIDYEDREGVTYTYTLLENGCLRIHKGGRVEICYSASAWESVQGDLVSGAD